MRATSIEQRYRHFLLTVSGSIFAGTIVELWFNDHTQEPIQLVPFVLSSLGFIAVVVALLRPRRRTLITLRIIVTLAALGSLLGVFEHITNNLAFELDIRPNATVGEVFMDALHGAAPLLAPGILALAAALAIAATYDHPALEERSTEELTPH